MTETELEPVHGSASTTWDQAFAALKARFPKAQDSVVFAIYTFQNSPDIALDDLKARAQMHGLRITAHSVNAARSLMMGRAPTPRVKPAVVVPVVERAPTPVAIELPAEPRRPNRSRERRPHVDIAPAVQEAITKLLREQSGTEAARLKEAIRQAAAVLQAAVK